MSAIYKNKELLDTVHCIENRLLRYFTACENERHHLEVTENAITERLIPKVEELLAEDGMEGGEHTLSRKHYQGQTGLFVDKAGYVANYQFMKGYMCDGYRKIGYIPFEGAASVKYEGEAILDMIEDLYGGISMYEFAKKYRTNIPMRGKDKLLDGLAYVLRLGAKNGFREDEVVDMFAYQNGVSLSITGDKKIMTNVMFMFISRNTQLLNMNRPKLEDGELVAGGKVIRFDITYYFRLADPKSSIEKMQLDAEICLVYKILPTGERLTQSIPVSYTPAEAQRITALMKMLYFPATLREKTHGVPVTVGEEFRDNYYLFYGTPEQKKAVDEKWASTDAGYRHILELNARNCGK